MGVLDGGPRASREGRFLRGSPYWFEWRIFEHAHSSHLWTDFDGLYVVWRLFMQGCAF